MRIWACAIVWCAFVAHAAASPPEVVVVATDDATFRRALGDALAPANMTVVPVTDRPPAVIELSIVSRQITEREHATSAVWLVVDATKTTLVAYDRDVDRVLVREVPYAAHLDAAQAAEVARMARTMLRTLRVTPEIDLPPPHVAVARVVRAEARAIVPDVRARELAVLAMVDVRVGSAASDAGLVGTVAASWRPDELGADLAIAIAPRTGVANAGFTGQFGDDALAVTAHAPVVTAPRLAVTAHAGGVIHRLVLDGTLDGNAVGETRLDPAARLGITAAYELAARVDLGVVMSADVLLRRQDYASMTQEVLSVPRVQLSTGLVVSVRIL